MNPPQQAESRAAVDTAAPQSRLPGSPRNDDDASAGSPPLSLGVAHWRGELPLWRAFWLHFVLPLMLASLALDALAAVVLAQGRWLHAGSVALLLGWPLLGALLLWSAVGTWRCASRQVRMSGSLPWHRVAQFALVAAALGLAASATSQLGPRLPELLRLASGGDSLGPAETRVSPDGRRLRLQGALGQGDAARIAQLLQQAPRVKLVELELAGGRLGEADAVAAAVQRQGAQTRAVGRCDGACVRVWLAGSARHLAPGVRLGLHREPVPSAHPLVLPWAQSWQGAAWREAGLPGAFVMHALSSPPQTPWRPDSADLVAAALTGSPEQPLDIALPDADGAQPTDYADALSGNPVWHAVERRRPGTIADAARRMHEARTAQGDDAAVQVEGQRAMQSAVTDLLDRAGPELRHQFLLWLVDTLGSAPSGAPACRAVLAGDAAALRALPAALARRQADWLLDAATEPDTGIAQARRSRLEIEVMRRSLGERAPALLLGLQREAQAQGRGPDCELATGLIQEVLQLPAAERRLALRLIYDR